MVRPTVGLTPSRILQLWPGLVGNVWTITSPNDPDYNCIAWAAEDTDNWWWPPVHQPDVYWPDGVPREETTAAFIEAYRTVGYVPEDEVPGGSEITGRVAIYCKGGVPAHAARQHEGEMWTSKLGPYQDIRHRLRDIEGREYGYVEAVVVRYRKLGLFERLLRIVRMVVSLLHA